MVGTDPDLSRSKEAWVSVQADGMLLFSIR